MWYIDPPLPGWEIHFHTDANCQIDGFKRKNKAFSTFPRCL